MLHHVSTRRSFRPSVLFGHMQEAYRAMRGKPAAASARRKRSAVTFEALEPRLLLSADLGPNGRPYG